MSKRRQFCDEFKGAAVGLIRQPGAQLSQVRPDIGVGLGFWAVGDTSWRPTRRRPLPARVSP
jgi:hypothetical protein